MNMNVCFGEFYGTIIILKFDYGRITGGFLAEKSRRHSHLIKLTSKTPVG